MNINKNTIKQAIEFYNIQDEQYLNKCYECIDFINGKPDINVKVSELYNTLYKDKNNNISEL